MKAKHKQTYKTAFKQKMTFREMLDDYRKKHIDTNSKIWINYCIAHNDFSIQEAIDIFCGKKEILPYNKHIYRRSEEQLSNFKEMLVSIMPEIKKAKNFDELLNCVSAEKTKGIADVTLYDITLLLSSCRKFDLNDEPHYVYSHAGAEKGIKNLCGKRGKSKYAKNELDIPEFVNSNLSPARLEDFLCRYKNVEPII